MEEVKSKFIDESDFHSPLWNPTKKIAPKLREKIQQPYARAVRFLHNEMTLAGQYDAFMLFCHRYLHFSYCNFSGESIIRLHDLDNLVEFYLTPIPNYPLIE